MKPSAHRMPPKRQLGWHPGHDKVLSELFADPRLSVGELALRCGYSRWHVSRIRNTPEFQRRYEVLLALAAMQLVERRARNLIGPQSIFG